MRTTHTTELTPQRQPQTLPACHPRLRLSTTHTLRPPVPISRTPAPCSPLPPHL